MRFFYLSLLLTFLTTPSQAQNPLLSPTQLQQEPVYFQLEKALENPNSVYKLYADDLNTNPQDFWEALPKFPNLQMLTLEGDFFETLPDDFSTLRNRLSILIIKDNSIAQWDKCFPILAKFRFLRSLSIEACNLPEQTLPNNIDLLQQVRELSLANTILKNLPENIGQLRRLEVLDIRSTQLTDLPESIGNLRNLHTLYLGISEDGYPNQIQQLPRSFSKLKDLQILHLHQNPIRNLPEHFERLHSLHTLHLNGCNQLNASKALQLLTQMPQLIDLSLSDVPLRALPADIKNWQDLERLDLSFCGLTFLSPQVLKLPNLKTLNLRGNTFPEETIKEAQKKIPNLSY